MSDDSSKTQPQALKCSECGAKITQEALQPGSQIICEYCGAIIMLPRPRTRQPPPAGRFPRRHGAAARRHPLRAPLLRTVKLLADKGAIDEKTLRKYTKRNIDKRMRPAMALRRALQQMRNDGKIQRDKVMQAVDELIAEKKLQPRARDNFARLFA